MSNIARKCEDISRKCGNIDHRHVVIDHKYEDISQHVNCAWHRIVSK